MEGNIYEYRGDRAEEIYTYVLNHVTSYRDPHQRISVAGYEESLRHGKPGGSRIEDMFLYEKKANIINYTCFYGTSPDNGGNWILYHRLELKLWKDTNDTPFNYLNVIDGHLGDPSYGSVLPLGDEAVVHHLTKYFDVWFYEVGRDMASVMREHNFIPNGTLLCKEYYETFKAEYEMKGKC